MRQPYIDLRTLALRFELGDYVGQLLGWGLFEPKPWRNFLHVHSYYEVCFVNVGSGIFRNDHRLDMPKQGDLFLARPGELHEIISSDDDPLGITFFGFSLEPMPHHSSDRATSALVTSFIDGKQHIKPLPQLRSMLETFTEEVDRFEIGSQYALRGMAVKVVLDTIRSFSDDEALNSSGPKVLIEDGMAEEIDRFLRDNLQWQLKVRDVATQFHLSERHINRKFKAETGRSIIRYLQDLRLERAQALLLLSDRPIGEIAASVGIEDSRYFATLFRQRLGVTPTEFRHKRGTITAS